MGFPPTIPVLTWLAGLAAVWLLWRPASTAYFKPQRLGVSSASGVSRADPHAREIQAHPDVITAR